MTGWSATGLGRVTARAGKFRSCFLRGYRFTASGRSIDFCPKVVRFFLFVVIFLLIVLVEIVFLFFLFVLFFIQVIIIVVFIVFVAEIEVFVILFVGFTNDVVHFVIVIVREHDQIIQIIVKQAWISDPQILSHRASVMSPGFFRSHVAQQ